MKARAYRPNDHAACLAIFDSNTPKYIDPADRPEYSAFLDNPPGSYLVIELPNESIVACGGWYLSNNESRAGLSWGLVHGSFHQKGIGSFLLQERLNAIRNAHSAHFVRIGTSQHTQGFFKRYGFISREVLPNGLGKDLDLIKMDLKL